MTIETLDVSTDGYYVYVLLSRRDNRLYVGFTSDLKKDSQNIQKGKLPPLNLAVPYSLFTMSIN